MKRLILVLLLALSLVGCRESMSPGETVQSGAAWTSEAIKYVHDEAHGVGCWFYVSESNTSISCLPDSEYLP